MFRQAAVLHCDRLPLLAFFALLHREAASSRPTGYFEIIMSDGWLTNSYTLASRSVVRGHA